MRKRHNSKFPVIMVAGVLVLIIVAALLLWPKGATAPTVNGNNVIVTVNGDPINQAEIDSLFNRVPGEVKNSTPTLLIKEVLLNQTIDQLLFLQEAKKNGVQVEDSFVNEQFGVLLAQNSMDEAAFTKFASENNFSATDIKSDFKKQLIVFKLINDTVIKTTQVSDKEIDDFYGTQNLGLQNVTLTNDTKTQIRSYLLNQKITTSVQILLNQLRASADIKKVNNIK